MKPDDAGELGSWWLPCWQSDNSIWNMAPLVLTGMQCGLLNSLALPSACNEGADSIGPGC